MSVQIAIEQRVFAAAMALPASLQRRLVGPPVVIDDQRLDLQTQLMLKLTDMARPAPASLDIPAARREIAHQTAVAGGRQTIGTVRDIDLGGIGGRVYTPRALTSPAAAPAQPTLVFFHGGGWIYGDLDTHDAACRYLAEHAGCRVVSVDYRLAPEHPYPAAIDDCWDAYRWVIENADEVGTDPDRVAVGGDSAGGYLSAQVAMRAAREGLPLALQLLIYPGVDFSQRTASRDRFNEGFYLTEEFMTKAQQNFLTEADDVSDPAVSPLLAEVPEGLAPAYVCTAGFDPLRDEGEAYAQKLIDAGVACELRRFSALIHGFINLPGVGTTNPAAIREVAAALARGLAPNPS